MGAEKIYDLENVVIIGTGLMGTGIAQVCFFFLENLKFKKIV